MHDEFHEYVEGREKKVGLWKPLCKVMVDLCKIKTNLKRDAKLEPTFPQRHTP